MKLQRIGYVLAGVLSLLFVFQCSRNWGEEQYLQEAQKYLNNGRFYEAINLYEEFVEKFPNSEYAAKALFMTGFIYANHVVDHEKARKSYNNFLEKYHDNELAESVHWEIKNLGTDINEIVGIMDSTEGVPPEETVQTNEKEKDTGK